MKSRSILLKRIKRLPQAIDLDLYRLPLFFETPIQGFFFALHLGELAASLWQSFSEFPPRLDFVRFNAVSRKAVRLNVIKRDLTNIGLFRHSP